jgi:tetratricopeptide (TPR) repeat protein
MTIGSRHRGRARPALLLVLGLLLATPLEARADPENARDHLKAGFALAEKGDWEKALLEFEEAHHLDPQPTTLFDVAQARMKTERYRAAIEAYRALLAAKSTLSSNQVSTAQRQLAAAEGKVARLSVTTSALPARARVTVDDQPMPSSPVVVDPGAHVVRAYEDERLLVERRVELGEGSETTLDLRETKASPVVAKRESEAAPRDKPSTVPWIVLGTSAVAIGVGAIFAVQGYGA